MQSSTEEHFDCFHVTPINLIKIKKKIMEKKQKKDIKEKKAAIYMKYMLYEVFLATI